MKKSLLLAAALAASASAYSQDALYIIGEDVNGSMWELAEESARMTEESEGVWTWSGDYLGSGFKINNGTWEDIEFNIGAAPDQEAFLSLDVPFRYHAYADSQNIIFDGIEGISKPYVVLNMNEGTITVTSNGDIEMPEKLALYVIGEDVNGSMWELAEESARMTEESEGVWTWSGDYLGSGFKINNGTWDDVEWNIGAAPDQETFLSLDVPFRYHADGDSQDIIFDGIEGISKPYVVLNMNEGTITVTGEGIAEARWYLSVNGNHDVASMPVFARISGGYYEASAVEFESEGSFVKVTDSDGTVQYGTYNPDEVFFSEEVRDQVLEPVSGEAGGVPCLLKGTYRVVFDFNNRVLVFYDTDEETPSDPVEQTLYVIGEDVNGWMWTLAEESSRMTEESEGVWTWSGDYLGSGFKINNGTWDDVEWNIGATPDQEAFLSLDVPFCYHADGDSRDIFFDDIEGLDNPYVVLDMNEGTITVTSKPTENYPVSLYIIGEINGNQPEACTGVAMENDREGVFVAAGIQIDGYFYFVETLAETSEDWGGVGRSYGAAAPDTEVALNEPAELVKGETAFNVFEAGTYTLCVNFDDMTVTLTATEGVGVNEISDENGKAAYYNLFGVRVVDPTDGIFVKVVDGKATKVIR